MKHDFAITGTHCPVCGNKVDRLNQSFSKLGNFRLEILNQSKGGTEK